VTGNKFSSSGIDIKQVELSSNGQTERQNFSSMRKKKKNHKNVIGQDLKIQVLA